jgi:TolA-binding protein
MAVSLALPAGAGEQEQIDFANGLFSRDFYFDAAQEYRAYLKEFPDGARRFDALYRLGEAESAEGNYDEALDAFAQLLVSDIVGEMRMRARLKSGVALYHLKRYDGARRALTESAKDSTPDPLRAEALYYLGKTHFDAGNTGDAAIAFKTLSEELGGGALAVYGRYQLAFLYLAQEQLELAAIEFSNVASSPDADRESRMECRFRAAEAYDKLGWFDAAVRSYEELRGDFPQSDYARRAAYGYAWSLYHSGQYAKSAEAAATFLREFPESPERAGVAYLQGNCFQQQERFDEALRAYAALRKDFAGTGLAHRAHYKTAWVHHLRGNADAAKAEAQAFLKDPPEMALVGDAAFLLGTILSSEGNFADAFEEFRLVAARYPNSEFAAEALYKSGECLAQIGRTAEAAETFAQFAEKFPENALAGDAVLRAADADFRVGEYAKASRKYDQILVASPNPYVEEQTLYRLALAHHNLAAYKESYETFLVLLEKFPKGRHRAEARLRVGDYLLRDAGQPLNSMVYFEAALEDEPRDVHAGRALQGLALAHYASKDYDGAAELFARTIAEHTGVPLDSEIFAWTGEHLFSKGDWDASIRVHEALRKRIPSFEAMDRVYFIIAEAQEKLGNEKESIATYATVIKAFPSGAFAGEARFRVARLREKVGDVKEAMAAYLESAETDSGEKGARARYRLGELLEADEQFSEAARHFMRIAILFFHEELTPNSLFRAATCFEKSGDTARARSVLEELLKDYPESPRAGDAQVKLASLPQYRGERNHE